MIGEAIMRGLRRAVANLLAPGVVLLVDDGKQVQELQAGLLNGETRTGLRRLQGYGFASHPLAGAEILAAFVGGNRDHGFVIGLDDKRYRMQLAAGEVAIFDDQGQKVHLTRAGIVIESALSVTVQAPAITLDGDVAITGTLDVTGVVTAAAALTALTVSAAGAITSQTGGAPLTMTGLKTSIDDFKGVYNGHDHPGDSGGTTGAPNQQA